MTLKQNGVCKYYHG